LVAFACFDSSRIPSGALRAIGAGARVSADGGRGRHRRPTVRFVRTLADPGRRSPAFNKGGSYKATFARPGVYRYLCTFHPATMTGTITVKP
jgi:plastocyanin